MKNYIKYDDKTDSYVCTKPFSLHVAKNCVQNLKTAPIVMLFGKIYTEDGKAFDVTECVATSSNPYSTNEEKDRYILNYVVGDMFSSKSRVKTINNVEIFFKMLLGGQILPDMEYQSIYDGMQNVTANNAELSVPADFYEYSVATFIRDAKDPTKQLRLTGVDKPFKSVSINQTLLRTNTYTAMTSKDPETMLVSTIANNDPNSVDEITPIEKTFRM